jgi:iron complex transport system permease protein
LGDLSLGGSGLLPVLVVVVFVAIIGIYSQSRSLNLLMVGERDALSLGVDVSRVRFIVFALASLITGMVVAVGGSVGYVGLIVPHIIRLAFGTDYRLLIPSSMIGGAILVLTADTVARSAIAPRELPVGAVLALIGAPLFLYLLRRTN